MHCGDNPCLVELAHICAMCNDSSLEFSEAKNSFDKVGEATEAALICLVEKMNVHESFKSNFKKRDLAMLCNNVIRGMYDKVFTLEFSRD
ncbi:unnamed protein product, partial [Protopolystoma xenopodis]